MGLGHWKWDFRRFEPAPVTQTVASSCPVIGLPYCSSFWVFCPIYGMMPVGKTPLGQQWKYFSRVLASRISIVQWRKKTPVACTTSSLLQAAFIRAPLQLALLGIRRRRLDTEYSRKGRRVTTSPKSGAKFNHSQG